MRASELSPRMFESDFVDFFSRTPWWTVPLIWVPVSLGLLAWGVWGAGTPIWQALPLFALEIFPLLIDSAASVFPKPFLYSKSPWQVSSDAPLVPQSTSSL